MTAEGKHEVRIHIDRQEYRSPTPTIGEALYALADIGKHRELFKEATGDHEDELIPRNQTEVRLHEDDHFYSQKEVTIIVNAQPKNTVETKLTFVEVVTLAFPNPVFGPTILYTVDYSKGPPKNPNGSLVEGQSVRIKNKMVFDVTKTDRS